MMKTHRTLSHKLSRTLFHEKPHTRKLRSIEGVPWTKRYLYVALNVVLFVSLVSLMTLLYAPVALAPLELPEVGGIVFKDIKSDKELLIEDKVSTQQRREEAEDSVLPVYDFDTDLMNRVNYQIQEMFSWLDQSRRTGLSQEEEEALRRSLIERIEQDITRETFERLLSVNDYEPLMTALRHWLFVASDVRIVEGEDALKALRDRSHITRMLSDGEEFIVVDTENMITMDELRRLLEVAYHDVLTELPEQLRSWLHLFIVDRMRATLTRNAAETEARRQKARDRVETVYFRAQPGEMIIREGEIVTEAVRLKIEALNQSLWTGVTILRLIGLAATIGLFLWLAQKFLRKTSTLFPRDLKTLYIIGTILITVALLFSMTFSIGQGIAELFDWPVRMALYLPPAALGAAMVSLIVGSRVALPGGSMLTGTILSFLAALMAHGGLPLFFYHLVGSLVGSFSLRSCRHRFDVLRAGLWIGLFQMITVPVVEALQGHLPSWDWSLGMGMALTGGLVAGLFALALIPLLEALFNVTTDSRLLELASGDHPLLRQLSIRAPGTYHHSVMMGNLAEAASEAIGGNPLMARVMALYHDIGKITKPHYFVENQSDENRHEHLAPSMSAKIIMSHIKEGVALAKTYKLGGPVLESIREHQGTTLLQFFFNKAVNEADRHGEEASELNYRYAGPRPQSPESGIIMLADSVEAAARSLKTPSSSQIRACVKRIISSKIADDQLSECKLTLRDVGCIEEAFVRVLTLGFFHHRLEYPDAVKKKSHNQQV